MLSFTVSEMCIDIEESEIVTDRVVIPETWPGFGI